MPNVLGVRRYYRYVSDGGTAYKYLTDEDLGTAAGSVLNDSLPNLPRRFKPRGVYCEATVAGRKVRKYLICPTNDNTLYAAEASTVATIQGTAFATTGRRGEQASWGRNPAGAAG